MQYYYLSALVLAFVAILLIDYRLRLAFYRDKKTTTYCLLASLGFFLAWDLTGVIADVFSTNQAWVSGLHLISSNLPFEELVFLFFLGYITLITWELTCLRTS